MKHTLTVLLCIAALAGAGVPTVSGYEQHQSQVRSQQAADAAANQAKAVHQASLNAQVKQLEVQCAKDKAAYAALSPAVQAKTVAPVCATNLVD